MARFILIIGIFILAGGLIGGPILGYVFRHKGMSNYYYLYTEKYNWQAAGLCTGIGVILGVILIVAAVLLNGLKKNEETLTLLMEKREQRGGDTEPVNTISAVKAEYSPMPEQQECYGAEEEWESEPDTGESPWKRPGGTILSIFIPVCIAVGMMASVIYTEAKVNENPRELTIEEADQVIADVRADFLAVQEQIDELEELWGEGGDKSVKELREFRKRSRVISDIFYGCASEMYRYDAPEEHYYYSSMFEQVSQYATIFEDMANYVQEASSEWNEYRFLGYYPEEDVDMMNWYMEWVTESYRDQADYWERLKTYDNL